MEIVSFLKMWMDVWNEAEEKGLKMPEEAILFRGKETENGEGMKEIIKFLPKRDFLAENGKTTVDALEKAVSQRNLMTILEKGQNAGENISFIEERKKKIAANMEVIGKRIQESRFGKYMDALKKDRLSADDFGTIYDSKGELGNADNDDYWLL